MLDVEDMAKLYAFMQSDEAATAMAEDGVKADTVRFLNEFTP